MSSHRKEAWIDAGSDGVGRLPFSQGRRDAGTIPGNTCHNIRKYKEEYRRTDRTIDLMKKGLRPEERIRVLAGEVIERLT